MVAEERDRSNLYVLFDPRFYDATRRRINARNHAASLTRLFRYSRAMKWRFMLSLILLLGPVPVFAQTEAPQSQTPDTTVTSLPEADKPLPPIADLLHDVERNQDAAEKMRRDYTYHVHVEEQDLDGKGNVKKTTVTDSESLTIDSVRVDRIVARDGKPLTPDEAKKESEKIDKEVAKDKERREKLEEKGHPTDSRGDQVLTVSRILELGQFTNPRRVELSGRPTIAADYAGDPKAKTNDRFETVFRDLVGTVWIDEADRTLVQVQGHFLNDFKVGGGLIADIRKGSSFSGKWSKINGEVWLPVEFTGDGKIRVLLVTGFTGRVRMVTSDYRKFRASATIVGGGQVVGDDGKPVVEQPPVEAGPEKQRP